MKKIKEIITNTLELESDVLLGESAITIYSNNKLQIENCKGIIRYEEREILLKTKSGVLQISGVDLLLDSMVGEEILVVGKIDKLEFL